jgi:type IV secretory pathway VirB10-like protein
MTNPTYNLPAVLAETDWEDLVNVLFLVVVVLLSILGGLAKKWKERQLLQEEKRRQQERSYGVSSQDGDEGDENDEGWVEVPPPAEPRRPLRPAPHPVQREPVEPDWDEESTPVPPPLAREATPRRTAEQALAEFVNKRRNRLQQTAEKDASEYLRARRAKQRRRQIVEDGHEHQTLHALGSPTSGSGGYTDGGLDQPRPNEVRLDAQSLRQAILYHEILGPPKALRDNPDPWDG